MSAYLDGALSADQTAEVEAMIAADPAVAETLSRLRDNDRLLRAALSDAVPDVADFATLRRFGIEPPASARPAAANDNRRWLWTGLGAAVAASLALFLAVPRPPVAQPWQTAQFAHALEATPSLQTASLPDDASISPTLSFAAGDGRFCREFKLTAKTAADSRDGIACRGAGGEWRAVALVAPAGALAAGNSIEVASGADPAALDAAYRKLAASDPLPAAEERALIAVHWPAKK